MTIKMQLVLPAQNPQKKNLNLMNNPLLAQSQTNVEGDQIVPSANLGKGRRRLGWQLPETTTSARNSDTPSKIPPDFGLPETPELSEAEPRSISESVKNLQAMESRDGKT